VSKTNEDNWSAYVKQATAEAEAMKREREARALWTARLWVRRLELWGKIGALFGWVVFATLLAVAVKVLVLTWTWVLR